MASTDVKAINAVVNNLTAKLNVVADKLHVSANSLMHVLCRQAAVDGIASIILGCVLMLLFVGCVFLIAYISLYEQAEGKLGRS